MVREFRSKRRIVGRRHTDTVRPGRRARSGASAGKRSAGHGSGRMCASRSSTVPTTRWIRRSWRLKSPGAMAVEDALNRARTDVMEPVMGVQVVVPEDYVGDTLAGLAAKRGHDPWRGYAQRIAHHHCGSTARDDVRVR